MRLISALFSASALLVAAPALAKEPKDKEAKPAKEKKICKQTQASYSRLAAQRECRTAAEWDAIRRETSGNRDGAGTEGQRIN